MKAAAFAFALTLLLGHQVAAKDGCVEADPPLPGIGDSASPVSATSVSTSVREADDSDTAETGRPCARVPRFTRSAYICDDCFTIGPH
jgi:hypothetical protein